MAVVHHVLTETHLPGGLKMATGKLNLASSYTAAGDPCNLANTFKSSTSPYVFVAPTSGYQLAHDAGNAEAGKIVARYFVSNTTTVNGAAANWVQIDVAGGTDLSAINASFIAVGQAY